jgi:hypothetical protein
MTLTEWMIRGLATDQATLAKADPVKVAAHHGLPVETVRFNLDWWRAGK